MAEYRIEAVDDSGGKFQSKVHQNRCQEGQADEQTEQEAESRDPVIAKPINPTMNPPRPAPPPRNGIGLQCAG